jgi:hypothetical protein
MLVVALSRLRSTRSANESPPRFMQLLIRSEPHRTVSSFLEAVSSSAETTGIANAWSYMNRCSSESVAGGSEVLKDHFILYKNSVDDSHSFGLRPDLRAPHAPSLHNVLLSHCFPISNLHVRRAQPLAELFTG